MRTIPDSLYKEHWADLSDLERRLFATYIAATLLYPPIAKKAQEKEKEKEWRRRKAVHALWSKRVVGEVDALLTAIVKGGLVTGLENVKTLAAPVSAYWHDNWVATLRQAGSPKFYNKKQLKAAWPKWVNLYLVASALIRLRNHQGKDASSDEPGLRQANWLVLKTYPRECGYIRAAKGLESLAQNERAIWPLVCGLMHCLVHKHLTKEERNASPPPSLHSLVAFKMPTTQTVIKTIRKQPERMLRASNFFMAQLAKPVMRRADPPLNQSDCVELPIYGDFPDTLNRPLYLAKLAIDEVKVADEFDSEEYSALKSKHIKARHSPKPKAD